MKSLPASVVLICLVLLGCRFPRGISNAAAAKPQDPKADAALLGRWITSKPYNGNVVEMDFKQDGSVDHYENGKRFASTHFRVETIQAHDERFKRMIAGLNDPKAQKAAADYSMEKAFGSRWKVVTISRKGGGDTLMFLLSAENQVLLNPMVFMLVRPGNENKVSRRIDRGDGSRAPFQFLDGQTPIFADKATGDWAYTYKGEWPAVLRNAAKELRSVGFEGPPIETEPAGLKGETGTVIYYRSYDSESVSLTPSLHSAWKAGQWVTKEKKGWVTVHVDIKGS